MQDILIRFLQSSRIDPLYFVTCVVDVISIFLWSRLGKPLTVTQRSLYKAVIFVAIVLTIGAFCRYFGLIGDWRELEPSGIS